MPYMHRRLFEDSFRLEKREEDANWTKEEQGQIGH